MTVHPRQVTPSLLQVDSILGRLSGSAALDEVCRFLCSELADYRSVAFYRFRDGRFHRAGSDGPTAEAAEGDLAGSPLASAATSSAPRIDDRDRPRPEALALGEGVRSRLTVPVRAGEVTVGAIVVESGSFSPLDASDARFLGAIAGRLAAGLATE